MPRDEQKEEDRRLAKWSRLPKVQLVESQYPDQEKGNREFAGFAVDVVL